MDGADAAARHGITSRWWSSGNQVLEIVRCQEGGYVQASLPVPSSKGDADARIALCCRSRIPLALDLHPVRHMIPITVYPEGTHFIVSLRTLR